MARRRSIDLDPMLASEAMNEWEQQQERAFVGWVNSLLRQHPSALTIEKLDTAFTDGIALICLLECLAGTGVGKKYRKQATKRIQQVENLNIALAFAAEAGLTDSKSTVSAEDFLDCVYPQIAGFVWTLFKQHLAKTAGGDAKAADAELLRWCAASAAKVVGPGRVLLENFTDSFADGVALAAIVASIDPAGHPTLVELLSHPAGPDRADQLVKLAVETAAGERLQVPAIVDPAAVVAQKMEYEQTKGP